MIKSSNQTRQRPHTLEVSRHPVIFEGVDFSLLADTVSLHFVGEEGEEFRLEGFKFGAGEDKGRGGGGDKSDKFS